MSFNISELMPLLSMLGGGGDNNLKGVTDMLSGMNGGGGSGGGNAADIFSMLGKNAGGGEGGGMMNMMQMLPTLMNAFGGGKGQPQTQTESKIKGDEAVLNPIKTIANNEINAALNKMLK